MKRILVLALGLLAAPQVVSAQLEVGLDAGFGYSKIDDVDDALVNFSIPNLGARVGFAAGPTMIIESLVLFDWTKFGDASATTIGIVPGLNFLINEQLYLRGEAGLLYQSEDDGVSPSDSQTQYLFGAGVGIRRPLGSGAVLRFEGAVDRALENTDEFLPASWDIRATVGVSAVIGG